MGLEDFLPLSGDSYGLTDGHVYIKRRDTFEPYVWGGKCMRVDEQTVTLRKMNITTRQSVDGGVERHQVRLDPPGESTFTLEMKRVQANHFKTLMRTCLWNVDHRVHCEGGDRDAWNKWEEITRLCVAAADERRMSGSNWEDTGADQMVTFPMTALETVDIYRVNGEGLAGQPISAPVAGTIVDIDACHGARCPTGCDSQQDCRLAAVTMVDADPYILTSLDGGDLDTWDRVAITAWTSSADFILCLGKFIIVGNTSETAIVRSDDFGVTQVEVDQTVVTDFAANAPTQIDGIDMTYILICGNNGYMYRSTDAGRNFETVDAGAATTENLTRVMIARDNPQVAYAVGANEVVIKTENGGETWFAVTTAGTGTIFGLNVKNQHQVLVVSIDENIYETVDGGVTWTAQEQPDGFAIGTMTHADIVSCGCDEYFLSVTDGTINRVYRNVYGGASGYWYYQLTSEWEAIPDDVYAIACCGPNRAIAVGGNGSNTNFIYLLA